MHLTRNEGFLGLKLIALNDLMLRLFLFLPPVHLLPLFALLLIALPYFHLHIPFPPPHSHLPSKAQAPSLPQLVFYSWSASPASSSNSKDHPYHSSLSIELVL